MTEQFRNRLLIGLRGGRFEKKKKKKKGGNVEACVGYITFFGFWKCMLGVHSTVQSRHKTAVLYHLAGQKEASKSFNHSTKL